MSNASRIKIKPTLSVIQNTHNVIKIPTMTDITVTAVNLSAATDKETVIIEVPADDYLRWVKEDNDNDCSDRSIEFMLSICDRVKPHVKMTQFDVFLGSKVENEHWLSTTEL